MAWSRDDYPDKYANSSPSESPHGYFNSSAQGSSGRAGTIAAQTDSDVLDLNGNKIDTTTAYNKITNYMPQYVDATDAYGNFKGAQISFLHAPSKAYIYFKAFITSFNETYKSDWATEHVFGRIDPIYAFKSTARSITLNFVCPASTASEAFGNLSKVGKLSDMLYPNYTKVGEAQTISQSPIVRMKVMNLLESQKAMKDKSEEWHNDLGDEHGGHVWPVGRTFDMLSHGANTNPMRGALGVITSLTINHNLEKTDAGVIEMGKGLILPKIIEVSVSFDVIHEVPRGWNKHGDRQTPGGPYGLDMRVDGTTNMTELNPRTIDSQNTKAFNELVATQQKAEQDRILTQQERDNATAAAQNIVTSLGDRQADRLVRRSNRIYNRGGGYWTSAANRLDALDTRIEDLIDAESSTDWNAR